MNASTCSVVIPVSSISISSGKGADFFLGDEDLDLVGLGGTDPASDAVS